MNTTDTTFTIAFPSACLDALWRAHQASELLAGLKYSSHVTSGQLGSVAEYVYLTIDQVIDAIEAAKDAAWRAERGAAHTRSALDQVTDDITEAESDTIEARRVLEKAAKDALKK